MHNGPHLTDRYFFTIVCLVVKVKLLLLSVIAVCTVCLAMTSFTALQNLFFLKNRISSVVQSSININMLILIVITRGGGGYSTTQSKGMEIEKWNWVTSFCLVAYFHRL